MHFDEQMNFISIEQDKITRQVSIHACLPVYESKQTDTGQSGRGKDAQYQQSDPRPQITVDARLVGPAENEGRRVEAVAALCRSTRQVSPARPGETYHSPRGPSPPFPRCIDGFGTSIAMYELGVSCCTMLSVGSSRPRLMTILNKSWAVVVCFAILLRHWDMAPSTPGLRSAVRAVAGCSTSRTFSRAAVAVSLPAPKAAGARRYTSTHPSKPPRQGQPLAATHPHLVHSKHLTPGIPASEYEDRRKRLMESLGDGAKVICMGNTVRLVTQRKSPTSRSTSACADRAEIL